MFSLSCSCIAVEICSRPASSPLTRKLRHLVLHMNINKTVLMSETEWLEELFHGRASRWAHSLALANSERNLHAERLLATVKGSIMQVIWSFFELLLYLKRKEQPFTMRFLRTFARTQSMF
mmetsp:Transcript_4106/g.9607  ORF Transcript_4106/g.9607 Transcript_4106/m.9607 type:complete len:121 (-) Transcript_4106:233-595(-)